MIKPPALKRGDTMAVASLPFVANLDFGHSSPMGLLPLGCRLLMDPIAESLEITEAAVV
jgi:muramoyltetrapeptide carboxypeptidase LdcA involved in peptidoglycan recycling